MRSGRSQVVRARGKVRRPAEKMEVPGEGLFPVAIGGRRMVEWARRRIHYFALLIALGWAVRFLLTSPHFEVQQVTVEGHSLLRGEQIVAAAAVRPQSIFLLEPDGIARSVESLPAVRHAAVHYRLPNELVIRVQEWHPVYAWKVGPQLHLVTPGGVIMGTTDREEGLLVIVDVDAHPVKSGDQMDLRALHTAEKLRELLPRALGIRPTYFEYSRTQGIILPSHQGIRVIFGWDDELEQKAATLGAVLDAIEREQLQAGLVDLRFQSRPYVR